MGYIMLHPASLTPPLTTSHFASPASSRASSPSHGSRTSSENQSVYSMSHSIGSSRCGSPSPLNSPYLAPRRMRSAAMLVAPMTPISRSINEALQISPPDQDAPMQLSRMLHLLRWDVLVHIEREFVSSEAVDGSASFKGMHQKASSRLAAIVSGRANFDDVPLSIEGYSWIHLVARFASAPHAMLPTLAAQGVCVTTRTREGDTVLHALMRNQHAAPHALHDAMLWAVSQDVCPQTRDVLGANAALIAAVYLPAPREVLALIDQHWPDVLRARDARGWGVADGIMANAQAPLETLLYVLTQCHLTLDSQRPAAWYVDLRGLLNLSGGEALTASEMDKQADAAARKCVLGSLAYEDDHAA